MTKYTAFRCPVELLPKAAIKAKADRRSLSNYIVTLIEIDTADVVIPAKKAAPTQAKVPASKSKPAKAGKAPAPKARKTAKK